MKFDVGYPEAVRNVKRLYSFYKHFPSVSRPFLKSFIGLSMAFIETLIRTVKEHDMGEPETNFDSYRARSEYDSHNNMVRYPAALMLPPFYATPEVQAVNYGALGHEFATQVMQIFVFNGPYYGEKGFETSPMTLAAKSAFIEASNCLKDLYLYLPKTSSSLWKWSAHVTDVMGMQLALGAYKSDRSSVHQRHLPLMKNYTSDQLFFVSQCFKYCSGVNPGRLPPHDLRCNLPAKNTEEFAAAFSCPSGSAMNPPKRCKFW